MDKPVKKRPDEFHETTPSTGEFHVVDMILDLTRSVSTLEERVNHLTATAEKNSKTLEQIDQSVSNAKVALLVAAAIIAAVGGLLGWVVTTAIDALGNLS